LFHGDLAGHKGHLFDEVITGLFSSASPSFFFRAVWLNFNIIFIEVGYVASVGFVKVLTKTLQLDHGSAVGVSGAFDETLVTFLADMDEELVEGIPLLLFAVFHRAEVGAGEAGGVVNDLKVRVKLLVATAHTCFFQATLLGSTLPAADGGAFQVATLHRVYGKSLAHGAGKVLFK
jgi:hypothetical protein